MRSNFSCGAVVFAGVLGAAAFGGAAHAQSAIPVNDPSLNVALNKPVINESGHWNGSAQFVPTNAVNGDVTEPIADPGGSGPNEWLGREGTLGENFTIDLGAPVSIAQIDLYNTHNGQFNDRGTINFHIDASNSVDGSGVLVSPTTILTNVLSDTAGQATITPNIFTGSFGTFQYLRFTADTAKNNNTGLNEIAVGVPEPASAALLGLGAAAMLFGRPKRRA